MLSSDNRLPNSSLSLSLRTCFLAFLRMYKESDDCVEDRQVRVQTTPEPLQRLVCSFPVQSIALARSWPRLCPLFHYLSTINMKSPLRTQITLLPLHSVLCRTGSQYPLSQPFSKLVLPNGYSLPGIARGHVRPP